MALAARHPAEALVAPAALLLVAVRAVLLKKGLRSQAKIMAPTTMQ